jgi:peptidoglycan/LPS O-acetylase OafA/YrhL
VLGIISVVQFHITWIYGGEQNITIDPAYMAASMTVFFGMDLFFILSGFLIGSILLRSLEVSGTQNIRRFYLRRILRTFPSYYVVLLYLVLVTPLTLAQRENLPYEFVYLTNFRPLGRGFIVMFWGWSLALEEQFYLAVPLLFVLLHRLKHTSRQIMLLAALMLTGLAIKWGVYLSRDAWSDFELYGALYFRTHTRFDALIAGVLLAFVHARYGERLTAWLREPLHRAMLAIPALTCLWLLLVPGVFGAEHIQKVHIFAWGTITSAMYLPTLILLLHTDGPVQRFLGAAWFRHVATLGYGVYLVHIPILDLVMVPLARRMQHAHVPMTVIWPTSLVLLMALSLVVAYAMHLLIEKPSLWLRDRLSRAA